MADSSAWKESLKRIKRGEERERELRKEKDTIRTMGHPHTSQHPAQHLELRHKGKTRLRVALVPEDVIWFTAS